MYTPLLDKIDILEPLIKVTEKPELMEKANFLYDRISYPDSYVVLLGETSCGKSSIINGLIGTELLPVRVFPSTAAISEIVFKQNQTEPQYFSINKDAKMRKISEDDFRTQCEHPNLDLARVRAMVNTENPLFNNLRIFDTPGYGSIVDEHEEVLNSFIPNSDVVIYTVLYRDGIQIYDYSFLEFLRELLRDDVTVILVINRCPDGIDVSTDPRIKEIKSYVSDILTIEPEVFYVQDIAATDERGHAMPACTDLWNYVGRQISTEKRKKALYDAFDVYIHDLYNECDNVIQLKYKEALLSENEYRSIRMTQREEAMRIREAAELFVHPKFEKIKSNLPHHLEKAETCIKDYIFEDISKADRLEKDEMVAYTNSHLIPFTIKREMGEVIQYIDFELTELNKQLDDYIQKEIIRFKKKIEIILESNVEQAIKGIAQEYVKKIMSNALSSYFMKYAGAAGIRGGGANATSHILKVVGEWFNKRFTAETHRMMQRIGSAVAKRLNVAITVVAELIYIAYDQATWKKKLKEKVEEGVHKWKEDTIPTLLKDMDELMETNISTLNEIAKLMEDCIDETPSTNIDECKKNVHLSESIKKQLKY